MNIDNLNKLIESVEKSTEFDPERIFFSDGTPASLSGHAVHLSGISTHDFLVHSACDTYILSEFLDIPFGDAEFLNRPRKISKKKLLSVLHDFKRTGKKINEDRFESLDEFNKEKKRLMKMIKKDPYDLARVTYETYVGYVLEKDPNDPDHDWDDLLPAEQTGWVQVACDAVHYNG